MPVRVSNKLYTEFKEYIKQYELEHGIQTIDSIRRLSRGFAATKSPLDNRAAQPIYYSMFSSICFSRTGEFPDDFNFDNPYDPDGLYPDDKDIQKKLKRDNLSIRKHILELIQISDEKE